MKFKLTPLLFVFFFFSCLPVFAQEFSFQKAWADHVYTVGQYQKTHEQFLRAKQAYNTYQTLSTRNEAVKTGVDILKAREEMVRTYLVMFRMKLFESKLSFDVSKQEYINSADILVSWLESRKSKLEAVGNIDDLNSVSREFEDKYPQIEALSYQMIGIYQAGNIGLVVDRITDLKEEIKTKAELEDEKRVEFDRSMVQIEEKISLAKNNRQKGLDIFKTLDDKKTKDYRLVWQEGRSALVDCQQYLREVIVFMDEVIKQL